MSEHTFALAAPRRNPARHKREFVAATGYRSVAERPLDPAAFPGAPPENLVPGSMVFVGTPGPVDLRHIAQWWRWTPGASSRAPEGPGSTLVGRDEHPVVHVSYEDAERYGAWVGATSPMEAEWELAARGGLDGATFTWGDEPEPAGRRLANYWHGEFPWRPDPGYGTTTRVGSFPPNGHDLFDMAGSVWEWTRDWYGGSESPRGAPPRVVGAALRARRRASAFAWTEQRTAWPTCLL